MRARRAGEKGVLYVEPDEDEQDRRREKRTMSYDERHQTGSISLNTMYDHLKKGPCKQTGFKPRMIVYETSSEEEAEKPKPLQDYQTKLSEKEVGSTKTAEEVKEQPAIKKLAKLTDKFVSEVSKKIPEDSSDTPKPDEGRSIIETENVIPGAETKAQEIKSRKQPAAPDVAKILEPKKTSSAEAVSSHLRSDPPKEKPPNEKAPSNIEVKIKKTIEKPDTQLLDLKKKPNLQENPSKSEIQGETHFSSRETSNQEQSSSIKVDKNMNSILESSSKLQLSEADQKPVRELITKEADKINSSLNTTKTDARSLHESSDRNTKIVDSAKTAKEEKASDVKLKLPDEINLTTLDTGVSLEDPLVPAETISIDEKISPSILIRNENSIAQDLQKLADDSVSPNEKLGPKKSKKKKEIILPKEEDFSDIEDDFKFGFKDFDLVYYWTWDVANETCAICRNNLMDMDVSLIYLSCFIILRIHRVLLSYGASVATLFTIIAWCNGRRTIPVVRFVKLIGLFPALDNNPPFCAFLLVYLLFTYLRLPLFKFLFILPRMLQIASKPDRAI